MQQKLLDFLTAVAEDDALFDDFVGWAASHGYDFTELDEADLDSVAGGVLRSGGLLAPSSTTLSSSGDLSAAKAAAMESQMDSMVDDAKSSYEQAKEAYKLSLRVLIAHQEQQSQVVQKITS